MERRAWQSRIFVASWLTYASFYLGRVNFSVALPYIRAEFGWGKAQVGLIGAALFWAYAFGQLVNGQLGERLGAREFVAAGLLASATLNLAFPLSSSLAAMALIWAFNGYFQATGWGPIVGLLAGWFGPEGRGRLSALFSPCYVVGNVVSWLLAGWLAARFGWRAVFWAPAGLMALSALHWYGRARNPPRAPRGRGAPLHLSLLWPVAVASFLYGIVEKGFLLWAPALLVEARGLALDMAAYSAVAMPLLGAMGIVLAGWAAEGKEPRVVAFLMVALGLLVLLFRALLPLGALWPGLLALGAIGATAHGANALMVTAIPLGLGARGGASSAAGFLDFASYLGAGLAGALMGAISDGWGWDAVFALWAAAAFAAALVINTSSRRFANLRED